MVIIMATTLAKRRGKLLSYIAEYEKRIKQYKNKYRIDNQYHYTPRGRLQIEGCKQKIKEWEKQLTKLEEKYDPVKDMRIAIWFTTDWFGFSPVGELDSYKIENKKGHYFLAKFAVENGLIKDHREVGPLGIVHLTCTKRRAKLIVAMRKDRQLSSDYRKYEKALQDFLEQKKIQKSLKTETV